MSKNECPSGRRTGFEWTSLLRIDVRTTFRRHVPARILSEIRALNFSPLKILIISPQFMYLHHFYNGGLFVLLAG